MMEKYEKIWNNVLDTLEQQINAQSFKTWFSDTKPIDQPDEETLLVKVPTKFTADYLNKNYAGFITKLYMGVFKKKLSVRFMSGIVSNSTNGSNVAVGSSPKSPSLESKSPLNPKYVFSHFVVGKSNNFAHSAAMAAAESPGTAYNPLFIYGESGMGKTHLMQAIGHFLGEDRSNDYDVHYITSEDFTNQMIDSLKNNNMPAFRNKYRNIDVLLIDDIHFMAKKEATQEEFFHTFNTLYDNNKQIVLTSDRPPKDIKELEARLVTRFEWGLLADLKTPDFETRMAILKKKAELEGILLSEEGFQFIAEHVNTSVRALEGSLIRILAYSAYNNINTEDIDRILCREILSDLISDKVAELNINTVMNRVCSHYELTPGQLLENTRKKNIVFPRQVAMYLTNLLIPQIALKDIATYYQRKDHTTVLHAKKNIENLFRNDNGFRIQIEHIIKDIKGEA